MAALLDVGRMERPAVIFHFLRSVVIRLGCTISFLIVAAVPLPASTATTSTGSKYTPVVSSSSSSLLK